MRADASGAEVVGQFRSAEHLVEFRHVALAMQPFRYSRIQPGTPHGQQAGDQPHARDGLLELAVMHPLPAATDLALMSEPFLRSHAREWAVLAENSIRLIGRSLSSRLSARRNHPTPADGQPRPSSAKTGFTLPRPTGGREMWGMDQSTGRLRCPSLATLHLSVWSAPRGVGWKVHPPEGWLREAKASRTGFPTNITIGAHGFRCSAPQARQSAIISVTRW
jgi:hypothetical protein